MRDFFDMTSMLKAIATIYVRRVRLIFRAKAMILSSLIQPALWVVVVGTTFNNLFASRGGTPVGIDYLSYLGAGIIGMTIIFTALFGGMSLVWDREFGILKEFLAAPISRITIPIGNAFAMATQGLMQAAIIFAIGLIIGAKFQISVVSIFGLLAVAIMLSLTLYGLAASIAVYLRNTQSFIAVMNLLTMPLFFVSGAIYPSQFIPQGLKQFAFVSPVTHAVDLIRYLILGANFSNLNIIWGPLGFSPPSTEAWLSFLYLFILSTATIVVAAFLFRRATST